MSVPDSHWFNLDDFRMACIPTWFDGFWDFPRNPTYRLLQQMVRNNRLPRLSVFVGPAGSGKTATAYLLGCASSCENFNPETHAPCGQCATCRYVRLGKDSLTRHALIEIDGADRSSRGGRAIDDVYEARNFTVAYRSSKPGDARYPYIVFIDEAHRLTPADREALLKLIERWAGANVILATTDIGRLNIPGPEDAKNPLLTRADVFTFSYPSREECITGLSRAAAGAGLTVDVDIAAWIVDRHGRCPRQCLGELYRLSNFGPHISRAVIESCYGTIEDQAAKVNSPDAITNLTNDVVVY